MDLQRGVKLTDIGFPFHIGDTAGLLLPLGSFPLDEAMNTDYTEFMRPILIHPHSATTIAQLPDKEGMMYPDAGTISTVS
jgi:seryl-tRNA synthetase